MKPNPQISGEQIIQEALRMLNIPRDTLSAKAISTALHAPAKRLADLAERFDDLLPRPDLKIVASAMPIFTELQAMKNHLIYTTRNTFERLTVVREAIQHLHDDGAVLIFPRGVIEPDPAVLQGAAESLTKWSRSLEIMIRKVPETQVMVTIMSGVISSWSLRNPLTWIRKEISERQKIAEILQGVQHLFAPRTLSLNPKLHFSPPMTFTEVTDRSKNLSPMEAIRNRAKHLLAHHTK
jgi:hypothetical protein